MYINLGKPQKELGDFFIYYQIGKGKFGHVHLSARKTEIDSQSDRGHLVKRDDVMACKIIGKKSLNFDKKSLEQEVEVMSKIDHQNIVRLIETSESANNFYLFMEYCSEGDLSKFISKRCKNGK